MILSVVMPVFNEINTLTEIIKKVKEVPIEKEIIIIDDFSTDGSRELLKNLNDKEISVYFHSKHGGKGAAVRTGFKHVTGDIIIIQDSDLEYDPREYNILIEPIKNGLADVVYGTRFGGGKPQRIYMFWHKFGNKLISLIANVLYNTTISDVETGYKLFHRKALNELGLKSNGFSIEAEISAKIFKNNKYRVYEVPISYYGRTYQEGKKITWRQGFSAIFTLIWYRFFD